MFSSSEESASSPEILVAAACVLFALLFALVDIHLWHPGAAWPDEVTNLQWIQEWREGLALPLSFFKGSLHRLGMALCTGLGRPSLGRLHWPALAVFPAESLALYLLARRQFSSRAGAWAVLINAMAAFTWLRLRSLLSYSLTPAELLLMLACLPLLKGFWRPLAWGLLAGLFLLDYEAWILAVPVLLLAFFAQDRSERHSSGQVLLGFVVGCTLVGFWSWPELKDYLFVRESQSLGMGMAGVISNSFSSFKGYWLGANTLANTGVSHWPTFPPFAWPALLLGLGIALKKKFWILAWVLIGFLPLISSNSAAEPQRMIVAWPALCLLAGAGVAWIQERWQRSLAFIFVVAIAGASLEVLAYARSMSASQDSMYGFSEQMTTAASQICSMPENLMLLTELDNSSAAAQRFFLDQSGLRSKSSGQVVALVPRDYAQGLEGQGRLEELAPLPGTGPLLLFFPDDLAAKRLKGIAAELGPLWKGLPRFQNRLSARILAQRLLQRPDDDPWVRSACFERAYGESMMTGEFPQDLVRLMESGKLQSVSGLVWAAFALRQRDPAWAARLAGRAFELDGRRRDALALKDALSVQP